MKKTIITVCVFSLLCAGSAAQGVTQSADGASTVILQGSAISLDLGKTDLGFGWNNLNNSVVTKNNGFLIGTTIKAKNVEGIGNLFSKGDLVGESSGSFYIGGYISNALRKVQKEDYTNEKARLIMKATVLFKDTLDEEVPIIAENIISREVFRKAAIDKVFNLYNRLDDSMKMFFPSKLEVDDPDAETRLFLLEVKRRFKTVKKFVEKEATALTKERFINTNKIAASSKTNYFRFTYYLFGGIDAMDFKRFIKVDSTNLENSFSDEYFRGGNFGIGLNVEYKRNRAGLTYSYVRTHNFTSLSATEYTLQSSSVVGGQTLQSKDVITAYSGGKYGKLSKNNLNADVIYNCRLDKDGKNILLLNPYVRASIFSRDTSLLINKTNIGVGGYFYKETGKFLGGLYIELPDVNNNSEKKKPASKQNLQPPLKRLSFGIVAKFSLKAIFGW